MSDGLRVSVGRALDAGCCDVVGCTSAFTATGRIRQRADVIVIRVGHRVLVICGSHARELTGALEAAALATRGPK